MQHLTTERYIAGVMPKLMCVFHNKNISAVSPAWPVIFWHYMLSFTSSSMIWKKWNPQTIAHGMAQQNDKIQNCLPKEAQQLLWYN